MKKNENYILWASINIIYIVVMIIVFFCHDLLMAISIMGCGLVLFAFLGTGLEDDLSHIKTAAGQIQEGREQQKNLKDIVEEVDWISEKYKYIKNLYLTVLFVFMFIIVPMLKTIKK